MKKSVCFMLLLGVALSLFACKADIRSYYSDDISASSTQKVDSPQGNIEMIQKIGHNTELVKYISTNDGMYLTIDFPSKSGSTYNLAYIDYTARTLVYLCGRPGCTHNNETCSSWLDATGYFPLFLNKDSTKLYLFKRGGVEADGTEDYLEKIYEIDPNGENRREIYRLRENESFGDDIAIDDENIYVSVIFYENALSYPVEEIRKINVKTGDSQTIYELSRSGNQYEGWAGAFDEYLILERMNETQMEYILYSLTTGQQQEVYGYDYTAELESVDINESTFVVVKILGEEIAEMEITDLRSGESIQINVPSYSRDTTRIDRFVDNWFSYSVSDTRNIEDIRHYNYFINWKTGEIVQDDMQYLDFGYSYPIVIQADAGDYYLVSNGRDHGKMDVVATDGTVYTVDTDITKYALILKEDYWNQRKNFIPIEDMVYGA